MRVVHSKRREFTRREFAITPIIGTIIIITIILSATATVLLWGLPYIERTKAEAQQENLYSQMRIFENTLSSLINQGPGATEENILSISKGTIQIKNNSCRMVIYYSLDDDHDFDIEGLDDQYKTYFYLYMNSGSCDKIKIYRLGTRTAYTRFNPETYFKTLESQDVKEYILISDVKNFEDRINNTAFHYEGSYLTSPPPPQSDSYQPYNDIQYDNIESPATSSVITDWNIWSLDPDVWEYLHYRFMVEQSISNIQYFNISWRGAISDSSSTLTLYIWNNTNSVWQALATLQGSGSMDLQWLNVSLSHNLSDYIYDINGKNYVSILVSGGNSQYSCTIYEDYVQMDVEYFVHDTLPPASYINESLKKIKIYYDPDSIRFNWTGKDLDNVTPPQKLRYIFRLDPSPYSTWQYIGENTSVTIDKSKFSGNRYPRGNYTFRVRAIDLANRTEPYDTEFNTYRFEVAVAPQVVYPSPTGNHGEYIVNLGGEDLSNDFIKMELFDSDTLFGICWIFDMTNIIYEIPTSSGTYGVSFENNAIIEIQPSGRYIKEPPSIFEGGQFLNIDVIQITSNSFSLSGNGQMKISSRITDHKVRETKDVYNLNVQIFGDNEDAWNEYLKAFYNFHEDARGNLEYVASPIYFTLVHTIAESRGQLN